MKQRFQQKEQRVLRFLKGSMNVNVLERLKTRGFTMAVHAQGQDLLANAVRTRSAVPPRNVPTDSLIPELEQLEKTWVPVAQASLEVRYPKAYEVLFAGYQRVSGIDVMLMLRLFVDRMEELRAKSDKESHAAIALLTKRGLTEEVTSAMGSLLERAMQPVAAAPSTDPERDSALAAEDAMWGFYLEWSRIARTVVKERDLQRALGFLGAKAQSAETPVPAPAPAPVPAPVTAPAAQQVA